MCRVLVLRSYRSVGYWYRVRTDPYRSIRFGIEAIPNLTYCRTLVGYLLVTEQIPPVYLGTYPTEHTLVKIMVWFVPEALEVQLYTMKVALWGVPTRGSDKSEIKSTQKTSEQVTYVYTGSIYQVYTGFVSSVIKRLALLTTHA